MREHAREFLKGLFYGAILVLIASILMGIF
jgi:hypothetical protein